MLPGQPSPERACCSPLALFWRRPFQRLVAEAAEAAYGSVDIDKNGVESVLAEIEPIDIQDDNLPKFSELETGNRLRPLRQAHRRSSVRRLLWMPGLWRPAALSPGAGWLREVVQWLQLARKWPLCCQCGG